MIFNRQNYHMWKLIDIEEIQCNRRIIRYGKEGTRAT